MRIGCGHTHPVFEMFSNPFLFWSKFPTDKTCTATIFGRYHTIFLVLALPLALLGMAELLPHASQLVAAWGIFCLGIFRFWLHDIQLDDEALEQAAKQYFLWSVPIFAFVAYAVVALCALELLGGAPP